eukprot:3453232-Amphidinium_carterae.3
MEVALSTFAMFTVVDVTFTAKNILRRLLSSMSRRSGKFRLTAHAHNRCPEPFAFLTTETDNHGMRCLSPSLWITVIGTKCGVLLW